MSRSSLEKSISFRKRARFEDAPPQKRNVSKPSAASISRAASTALAAPKPPASEPVPQSAKDKWIDFNPQTYCEPRRVSAQLPVRMRAPSEPPEDTMAATARRVTRSELKQQKTSHSQMSQGSTQLAKTAVRPRSDYRVHYSFNIDFPSEEVPIPSSKQAPVPSPTGRRQSTRATPKAVPTLRRTPSVLHGDSPVAAAPKLGPIQPMLPHTGYADISVPAPPKLGLTLSSDDVYNSIQTDVAGDSSVPKSLTSRITSYNSIFTRWDKNVAKMNRIVAMINAEIENEEGIAEAPDVDLDNLSDTEEEDNIVLLAPSAAASFSVPDRPAYKVTCTKATKKDTLRLQASAKALLKYPESSEIQSGLTMRVERMAYMADMITANFEGEEPKALHHMTSDLQAFLRTSRDPRVATGELARIVDHEIEWADWINDAAMAGVMHVRRDGCTCRSGWD
ncbi:hypothetical protein GQ43DRAFT_264798 [Delitschia confertaspora ATCC 74209]|uniref:Uncharacterized protein n=1 Tax=Delitschia confertaspora ATCC 74209 TaxID=1513339 RepID=A0A9P4JQQ2_9PLEO|nr:hypothetical protein GQ43DRAFT_264798 [Delitschia confertaspora ATCC 74209]